MVDAPAEQRTQLHIISHLDWEREGQRSFDEQRALLLDILAQLSEHLQSTGDSRLDYFLLGGQTIILNDVAQVRPDLLTSLVIYHAGGRLGIGPWYIQMDGLLADGEALVRNLLLGQADAQRHGVHLMPIAYMPHVCQHTAQLPQILRGFEIDSAFLCLGNPVMPLPFKWEAHNGSSVLVMNYQQMDDPVQSVNMQRDGQPDGPFLWMHRVGNTQSFVPDGLQARLDIPVQQSNLKEYAAGLREKLPDDLRPTIKGEVHLQHQPPTSGRFSARIAHKQENARLQSELTFVVEPLLALALAYGQVKFPQNQKALLEYSWRLLLQNQARYPAAGAVSDAVQEAITIRSRRIVDNSQVITQAALNALPGIRNDPRKALPATLTETYITVWNPHGCAVQNVAELTLNLPDAVYPAILLSPAGEEIPFGWNPATRVLDFRADVPSIGYAVYTLKLSQQATAGYNQRRVVAGVVISNEAGESLTLNNGRLDWVFNNYPISDLLSFHDTGDAGDVWHYAEPQPDVPVRGGIVDVVQVEATPTYERLIFRHRMRIAPGLNATLGRVRGLKVLDMTTTATYYNDVPGLYFRTTFNNSANDHRLRAHIRTGLDAEIVYTDAAFGVVKRPIPDDQPAGSQPLHSVAVLYDNTHGLGLFTRGLSEFEPLHEDNQVTLGLTLLRAVGWLDRPNKLAAPGAQMQGDTTAEFMLMPMNFKRNHAQTIRLAGMYRAPLRAVQYDEKPPQPTHSYLEIDDDRVVMTTLKPPQDGAGMIIRLLNPSVARVGVNLKPSGRLQKASRVSLAETHQADYAIENGHVNVTLEPHQIVTVRLGF